MLRYALTCIVWISFAPALGFAGDRVAMEQHEKFREWKNRPAERFTNAKSTFETAKKILLENYIDRNLTEEKLYEAALLGMLKQVDPDMQQWNTLITPSQYAEMKSEMESEIVGLGIELKFNEESGISQVISLIPGSPALSAGVKAGDQILKVDGKSFRGKEIRDMVYSIRGKEGTDVTLTLLRDEKILKKKVRRTKIAWEPVTHAMIDDKIGLIQIQSFTEKTESALQAAFDAIEKAHAKGLVLDLRENQGGMFEKAVACLDPFLGKGEVLVQTLGRDGKSEKHIGKSKQRLAGIPIVVLMNQNTFSAGEFFAAALSEVRGATLVGATTHGKWSVQKIVDLPNGFAMKYTVAKFASPSGKSYAGVGLKPDIQVNFEGDLRVLSAKPMAERLEADSQLRAALSLASNPLFKH